MMLYFFRKLRMLENILIFFFSFWRNFDKLQYIDRMISLRSSLLQSKWTKPLRCERRTPKFKPQLGVDRVDRKVSKKRFLARLKIIKKNLMITDWNGQRKRQAQF